MTLKHAVVKAHMKVLTDPELTSSTLLLNSTNFSWILIPGRDVSVTCAMVEVVDVATVDVVLGSGVVVVVVVLRVVAVMVVVPMVVVVMVVMVVVVMMVGVVTVVVHLVT